jgi:hypothetical protein
MIKLVLQRSQHRFGADWIIEVDKAGKRAARIPPP